MARKVEMRRVWEEMVGIDGDPKLESPGDLQFPPYLRY